MWHWRMLVAESFNSAYADNEIYVKITDVLEASFLSSIELFSLNLQKMMILLDASLHLYKRVCPSVGRSVGPSGDAIGNTLL